MKLRYAVVGYGFIGRRHVDTLINSDEADCVAVCDVNFKRLQEVLDKYPEMKTFLTLTELLATIELDGVIIAANNNQHKDLVIEAAKARKHIICEKPVALSTTELDEMMEVVDKSGVTLTVHQQRRFDKDFRTVKAIYDDRILGEVYTIQSSLYGFNGNMHDWHVFKSEGGGMLYDWGVHLIDQILYMVDSPLKTVYADVRNVINKEVDDYFKILLRFENNVTAEIELGTYFLTDKENWFERHWFMGGNKGSMYCDKFNPEGCIVRTSELLQNVAKDQEKSVASYGPTRSFGIPKPGLTVKEPLPTVDVSHHMYFDKYFKAIKGEEEMFVKVSEVRKVLAVMEACWESARTMRSIDFE